MLGKLRFSNISVFVFACTYYLNTFPPGSNEGPLGLNFYISSLLSLKNIHIGLESNRRKANKFPRSSSIG
jgi:hypothetical protein